MSFDLETYLSDGVREIVSDALKAALSNPKQSLFFTKYAAASRAMEKRRLALAKRGDHIPTYLICSITSACNLHCAGCYSRANHACNDEAPVQQLTGPEWGSIFAQASELGIGFILLAGGEPLLRPDVIRAAAEHPDILFPVFTNGTLFSEQYLALFEKHRNLVPILSMEGGEETTDERRGGGVHQQIRGLMAKLKAAGILFGTSITVTTENLEEVMSDTFLSALHEGGVRVVIFTEFVPVTEETSSLAPGDAEREKILARLDGLRSGSGKMVYIAFPGDEKLSDGCLAAGRGFFHINSHGGAEPCPFSPYSDINVKDTSLLDAIRSRFFKGLNENGLLKEEHNGGCTLFERREEVEALLRS